MNEKYKVYIDKLVAKGKDEESINNFMYGLGYKDKNEYLPYYYGIVKKKDEEAGTYDSSYQPNLSGSSAAQEEQDTASVSPEVYEPKNQLSYNQKWLLDIKDKAFIDWTTEAYEALENKPDLAFEYGEVEETYTGAGGKEVKETFRKYALESYDDVMRTIASAKAPKPQVKYTKDTGIAPAAGAGYYSSPPVTVWETNEEAVDRVIKEQEAEYRKRVANSILDSLPEEMRNDPDALKDMEFYLRNTLMDGYDLTGENEIGNLSTWEQLSSKFKSGAWDAISGVLNLFPDQVFRGAQMGAAQSQVNAQKQREKQNTYERNIIESMSAKDYDSAFTQMLGATAESTPLLATASATTLLTGNPVAGAMVVSSIATSAEELRTRNDTNFMYYLDKETGEEFAYDEAPSDILFNSDKYELRRDDAGRGLYLASVFGTELVTEYFTGKIFKGAMEFDPTGQTAKRALTGYMKGIGVSIPEEALPEALAQIGTSMTYDMTTKGELRGSQEYLAEAAEAFMASSLAGPAMRVASMGTVRTANAVAKDLMGRGNKFTSLPVNLPEKLINDIKQGTIETAEANQQMTEFFDYARTQRLVEGDKDVDFYRYIQRKSPEDLAEIGRISSAYTFYRGKAEKAKTEAEKKKYTDRMDELVAQRNQIESKYEEAFNTSMENSVYERARQSMRELAGEITAIDRMIAKIKESEDTEYYDEAEVEVQRFLRGMAVERLGELMGYVERVESLGDAYGTELFDEGEYMTAFEELASHLKVPFKKAPAETKAQPTTEEKAPPTTVADKPTASTWSAADQLKWHNENTGSTFNTKGETQTGKGMAVVSIFPDPEIAEVIDGELTQEQLQAFYDKNKELLEANSDILSVGTFYDAGSGKTYLDVSVLLPKDDAVRLGQEYNQISVYDLDKNAEIKTGGDGTFLSNLPSVEDRIKQVRKILNEQSAEPQQAAPDRAASTNVKSPSPAYKAGGVRTFGAFGADIARYTNKLFKAFSKNNPDLRVVIHRDQATIADVNDETRAAAAGGAVIEGFYDGENTIHLMDTASPLTVLEEFLHTLKDVFRDADFRKKLVDDLNSLIKESPEVAAMMQERMDLYKDFDKAVYDEEMVVGFLTQAMSVAENNRSFFQKLVDFFNRLLSRFVGDVKISSKDDLMSLTNSIVDAVKQGRQITVEKQSQNPYVNEGNRFSIRPETSYNYASLTEDGEGNFVFYHTSPNKFDKLDPSLVGKNSYTTAAEAGAFGAAGGVSMFYSRPDRKETFVSGNYTYEFKVPKERVYDFNADPKNFIDEAKRRFKATTPFGSFSPNHQVAFVTQVANENGFDIVVAKWNDKYGARAHTTLPLSPTDFSQRNGNVVVKDFANNYTSNAAKGWKPVSFAGKEEALNSLYDRMRNAFPYGEYPPLYQAISARYTPMGLPDTKIMDKLVQEADISDDLKREYWHLKDVAEVGDMSVKQFDAFSGTEEFEANLKAWERLPEGHQSIFELPDGPFTVTYDTTEDTGKSLNFMGAEHFMGWLGQNLDNVQKLSDGAQPIFRNLKYDGKPLHVGVYSRIGDSRFSLIIKRAGGLNSDLVQNKLNQKLKQKLSDAKGRPTKRLVGEILTPVMRKLYGSVPTDPQKLLKSPRHMKKMALVLADEIQWMIEGSHKEGIPKSGYGWYSEYFDKAMDMLNESGAVDLSTQDSRDFFTALVAITSNQEKLFRNLEVAVALHNNLYEDVANGRPMNEDFLKRAEKSKFATKNTDKVVSSIRDYGNFIQRFGGIQGAKEFMLKTTDRREFKKMVDNNQWLFDMIEKDKHGKPKISSDFLIDEVIPTGALFFGPKLGFFYANLSKQYDWLTMDRWWTRSFNRVRGTMLPKVSLNELRKALNDYETSDARLIRKSIKLSEKYRKSGFSKKEKTSVAVSANTVYKNAFTELKDAPSGGNDRRAMMRVADMIVEEMKDRGYEFTVANVQEVIWFYEKYFFKEIGVAGPAVADYHDEAENIVSRYAKDPSFLDAGRVITNSKKALQRYADIMDDDGISDSDAIEDLMSQPTSGQKGGDTPQTRFSISNNNSKRQTAESSPFYISSRNIDVPVSTNAAVTEASHKLLKGNNKIAEGKRVTVSPDMDVQHLKGATMMVVNDGTPTTIVSAVRLKNLTFSYDQKAIDEARGMSRLPSKAMYSASGNHVALTDDITYGGVELSFNPLMDDGFVDPSGRPVVSVEDAVIVGNKVYASGEIVYGDRKPVNDVFTSEPSEAPVPQAISERFAEYMNLLGVKGQDTDAYYNSLPAAMRGRFAMGGMGKKMRRFAERAMEYTDSTVLKQKIVNNPQNYYDKQSIEAIKDNLTYMSDAQLISEMKQDALFTLYSGNNDHSVLAGIELLNRAMDRGDWDAADEITAQLSTMGTTAGRVLRHYAEMPSSTPSKMKSFIEEGVRRAGKELTDEQKAKAEELSRRFFEKYREIQDVLNRLANGEDLADQLKVLIKEMEGIQRELDTFANPLIEDSWSELLTTIMQGNLLTPVSQVVNVTANVGTILLNVPLRLMTGSTGMLLNVMGVKNNIPPVSLSAYYYAVQRGAAGVLEALHQIRTGQENSDYEFRVSRGLMPVRSIMAAMTGNGLAISNSKADEINQRMKLAMKGTFGVPAEIMFRFLSLGDIPFKRFEEGLYAASVGRRMGLEGDALKQFIKFPPPEVSRAAAEEGRKVTFQNESRTYAMTEAVMQSVVNAAGPQLRPLMQFMTRVIMPFRKTPANILEETLTYASPLLALAKTSMAISRGDTKAAIENISKAFLGQMVYSAVDILIANGLISLPIGMDEEERNLAYETFPPSSINLSGLRRLMNGEDPAYQSTDVFARYDRVGTVGVLMGARAVSTPKEIATKNISERLVVNPISSIFGLKELSTLSYMMDQSYLQGVNGFLTMLSYRGQDQFERQVSDWFETSFRAISAIPLPNTLSAIHRAEREYMPDYRDASLLKRMENIIKDRTFNYFGAAEQPPVRIDWKGDPIEQTPDGNYSYLYNLVDPFKVRQGSEDPIALEALEIFEETGEIINVISVPRFARASVVRAVPSKDSMSAKEQFALRKLNKEYKFLSEPKEGFAPELNAEESNRLIALANKDKYNEAVKLYSSNGYGRMSNGEKLKEYSKINNSFNSAIELDDRNRFRPHTIEFLDILESKYMMQYGDE